MLLYPRLVKEDHPGLQNVVHAAELLFSGSEPRGTVAFASLKRLGVRTIVSVDGARPEVEEARALGMRYVHLPMGYDGVPARTRAALARVLRECEGPVYVHCHHGKHRGPAAAAIACVAAGRMTARDALRILEISGTGKEYAGLWRDVERAGVEPATDEAPELPVVAEVESLVRAMASLDRHWDRLKQCRDAGWKAPASHPDLEPAHAALLVREGLREAHRAIKADEFDRQFREWLNKSEATAARLEEQLRSGSTAGANDRLADLEQQCLQCHAEYRN